MTRRSAIVELVDRLARKLGSNRVELVGCLDPELIAHLAPIMDLGGLGGSEQAIRTAAKIARSSTWTKRDLAGERWATSEGRFDHTLVILDAELIAGRDARAIATQLGHVLERAHGAVVWPVTCKGRFDVDAAVSLLRELGIEIAHIGYERERVDGRTVGVPFVVAGGGQASIEPLLRGGGSGLPLDPAVAMNAAEQEPGRKARVAIVSFEAVGPTKNGGIGTAATSLADALATNGHSVDFLFTGFRMSGDAGDDERWVSEYADRGIRLELLGPTIEPPIRTRSFNSQQAWAAYTWARRLECEEPLDVLHFPECQGHGYFCALAKQQGLAFENTTIVVGLHSPTIWVNEANDRAPDLIEALVDDLHERRSVELADVLVSPSRYLVDWIENRGWRIPRRTFVQPYVRPRSVAGPRAPETATIPNHLVFFGRLEHRKGLYLFCDALDELARSDPGACRRVTFLGKQTTLDAGPTGPYINHRARRWPWKVTVSDDLGHREALDVLRDPSVLAIMPSLIDNSPNTVLEALSLGTPFLTTASGGTVELIDPRDHPHSVVDIFDGDAAIAPRAIAERPAIPKARRLHVAIRRSLRTPVPAIRPAIQPEENETVHVGWHAAVARLRDASATDRAGDERPPRPPTSLTVTSVVGASEPIERELLRSLIDAGEGVEGLVIELAGTGLEVNDPVTELAGNRVRHVMVEGRERASGYSAAVELARGDWLLFLAHPHVLDPREVEPLRRALSRSDADLLVLPAGRLDDANPLVVPPAGPALDGLFGDPVGLVSFAVRRSSIELGGGFVPDLDGADPSPELRRSVALAGGRVDTLALVAVRRFRPDPAQSFDTAQGSERRALRPFAAAMPPGLGELPGVTRGWWRLHASMVGQLRAARAENAALQGQLARARGELELLASSKSWRMTKPLRASAEALRGRRRG